MKNVVKAMLRRLAILIGSWSWVPQHLERITRFDKFLQRKTGGSLSLMRIAGLPGLVLTVDGRKTGLPRSSPLLCTPYDGGVLIAGSNFGGPRMPAWVGNLRASGGRARVFFEGAEREMVAAELSGEERTRAWARMVETWPNYRLYERRTDRTIPVFWLRPAS